MIAAQHIKCKTWLQLTLSIKGIEFLPFGLIPEGFLLVDIKTRELKANGIAKRHEIIAIFAGHKSVFFDGHIFNSI
jgi:hypothetical protein